jgi:hypothetical protein
MHPYLAHREEMAKKLTGRLPQSRMNLLQAQLDARGKTGDYRTPSTMVVKLVKQFNASDAGKAHHNKLATKALDSYLKPPEPGESKGRAMGLNEELNFLASYITAVLPMAHWIEGPLKTVEKAMGKTEKEYDYLWSSNKDLVRGTLACESQSELSQIAALVIKVCDNKDYAMKLIKKQEQKSVRDGGQMVAGYSGWNFAVEFKEHPFAAEIQANTFSMMYGKMSKDEFCKQLKVDLAKYEDKRMKALFPGGLGHALYDIQDARFAAPQEDKVKARNLALDYHDLCRNQARKPSIQDINNRIRTITFKSEEARKHWKKAVDGSGGLM